MLKYGNILALISFVIAIVVLLCPSVLYSGLTTRTNTGDSLIKGFTVMQHVIAQQPSSPDNAQQSSSSENAQQSSSSENAQQSSSPENAQNKKPKADAGPDQTVRSEETVTLDGTDSEASSLDYEWQRTDNGPQINDWDGFGNYEAKPTFTAPSVDKTTKLTFSLKIYDEYEWSDPDTVTITVKPKVEEPPLGNKLALVIQVEKDPINVGDKETLTITAVDKTSNENVVDAKISGKVTSNGYTKKLSDNDGEALYSWKIGSKTDPGKFNVIADATAEGYEPGHGSKTFYVINEAGPTTNDPTTNDPTTNDPTTNDPTTNDPTTNDPTTNDPTTNDPTTNGYSIWIVLLALVGAIALGIAYAAKHRHLEKVPVSHVEVMTQGGIEEY